MKNSEKDDSKCCIKGNKYWWATLVVAVLAVPSFGIIITLMTNTRGLLQVWIFMLACWFCTYLGMRLMKNPRMNEKFDIHKNP